MSLDVLDRESTVKKVELHFDVAGGIDHPVVPFRWCLSPATIKYMRDNPEKDWALVIIGQKPSVRDESEGVTSAGNARHETRLIIKGFRAISECFGFMEFHGPGFYNVVAYLVHSGDGKRYRTNFWRTFPPFEKRTKGVYDHSVDILDSSGEIESFEPDSDVHSYAHDHVTVDLPVEAFPKPMPKQMRALLNFYGFDVGEDQCAGRGYVILAILFSIALPFLYVFFFVLTRLWLAMLGVAHFLLGGNPLVPWAPVISWRAFPDGGGLFMRDEYTQLPPFRGIGVLFVPLVLLLVGGLLTVGFLFSNFGWWLLGGVVAIFTAIYFGDNIDTYLTTQSRKSAQTKREREAFESISLIERYAICGGEKPKGPRSFRFAWTGIKRSVCKPRAL